jgi:hypothetical protein
MFNWLFGKKEKDETAATGTKDNSTLYREYRERENEQRKQQAIKDYGSIRSFTFTDGKTFEWDLDATRRHIGGDWYSYDVYEVVNGVQWKGSTLKYLQELSPPAKQLFLVLVKDQRNIKIREVRGDRVRSTEYIHEKLGISVQTRYYADTGDLYIVSATGISIESANQAMSRYEIYTKVFNLESRADRYKRVRAIRDKKLQTRKLNAYLKTLPE